MLHRDRRNVHWVLNIESGDIVGGSEMYHAPISTREKPPQTHLPDIRIATDNANIKCPCRPKPPRNIKPLKRPIYYYKCNHDWAETGPQKSRDIVRKNPRQTSLSKKKQLTTSNKSPLVSVTTITITLPQYNLN